MYKIYYTLEDNTAHSYDTASLSDALKKTQEFRNQGYTFVTMVSENPNQVGPRGVAAVENGVLPDGSKYEQGVGSAFKSKPVPVSTDNLEFDLDDPR